MADEKRGALDASHPDHAFYSGKVQAALFYARNILPGVEWKSQLIEAADRSPIDITDAGFASI